MLKASVSVDGLSNARCAVWDSIKLDQVGEPLRNPPHVQPPFSAAVAASHHDQPGHRGAADRPNAPVLGVTPELCS